MTRKTSRRYGSIYALIRRLASMMPEITWKNLTPALTPRQAKNNLMQLYLRGELRMVRKGKDGCRGIPAVYSSVRKPSTPSC